MLGVQRAYTIAIGRAIAAVPPRILGGHITNANTNCCATDNSSR
jgi:hypothetical protein